MSESQKGARLVGVDHPWYTRVWGGEWAGDGLEMGWRLTAFTCAYDRLRLEEKLRELVSAAVRDAFLGDSPIPFMLPIEVDSQKLSGCGNWRANLA